MSPLKIALLLRLHAYPRPNGEIPDRQAHAPAMRKALSDFIRIGLVDSSTTLAELQFGPPRDWLTEAGDHVVDRLCAIEPESQTRDFTAAPPPVPPGYESMRDQFAMAALPACVSHGGTPERYATEAYKIADAMLEARK